jgi:hypothetical protein
MGGLLGALGVATTVPLVDVGEVLGMWLGSYCIFHMGTMAFFTVLINCSSTKVREMAGHFRCSLWHMVWKLPTGRTALSNRHGDDLFLVDIVDLVPKSLESYCIFYMGTMVFFFVLINGGSTKVGEIA